jgi:hypothetical protein
LFIGATKLSPYDHLITLVTSVTLFIGNFYLGGKFFIGLSQLEHGARPENYQQTKQVLKVEMV